MNRRLTITMSFASHECLIAIKAMSHTERIDDGDCHVA